MLFTHLTLVNIRSYKKQELQFPQGVTLLAGDIGSGKSTILLAIEFALFGLARGTISGTNLLRHGAPTGMVELTFTLNEKKYTIRRVLKRNTTTIEQESGYLLTDGQRKDGTATELKSWILTILGYPPDQLTKNKTLIYRYTLYTPQEEMKHILLDTPENRLDVLTKVFNIDKYKRIKENTQVYTRRLRERIRLLEGQTTDLPDKLAKHVTITLEKNNLEQQLSTQRSKIAELTNELTAAEQTIITLEQTTQQHIKKQQTCELLNTTITHLEKNLSEREKEHTQTTHQLIKLQQELTTTPPYNQHHHQTIHTQLTDTEKNIVSITHELGKIAALQNEHGVIQKNISTLNFCPLCQQQVTHDHKKNIITEKQHLLKDLRDKHITHTTQKEQLETQKKELQQEDRNQLNLQQQTISQKLKEQLCNDQVQRKKELEQLITAKQKELLEKKNQLDIETKELTTTINTIKEYESMKKKLTELQHHHQEQKINLTRNEERHTLLTQHCTELTKELTTKQEQHQQKENLKKKEHWLTDHFTYLLDNMERTVFTRIWNEFDSHFTQWFSMLIEDDLLTARLDDSCSPVIQQNGHETTLDNLSGGEKTACALAYRLALNKVINNMIATIQTKDTLILDEPTDGFSTEQLDKLKDVIDALQTKQVIIVSHEKKIEGFVDHIIHITKKNHVSEISTTISTA